MRKLFSHTNIETIIFNKQSERNERIKHFNYKSIFDNGSNIDDIVEKFVYNHKIKVPVLSEKKFHSYEGMGDWKSYYMPFSGDETVFNIISTDQFLPRPLADIQHGNVIIEIKNFEDATPVIASLNTYLSKLAADVKEFNESIEICFKANIDKKKEIYDNDKAEFILYQQS